MTSNFSFPRLLKLIQRQWVENSRMYIFSMLALLGLTALVFTFWILTDGPNYRESNIYLIFIGGLFISGSVFASMAFNALGDKPKGIYWLSFPASHLEKLISMIFYSTIVFIVVYLVCFFSIKTLAVAYVERLVAGDPKRFTFIRVADTDGIWQPFRACMYAFVAVQSFFLLGSVYFSRYSFVLTAIVSAALFFIFVVYCDNITDIFLSKKYNWDGLSVRLFEDNYRSYRKYELSSTVGSLLTFLFRYMWAPVFWVATWYRLKEKQI